MTTIQGYFKENYPEVIQEGGRNWLPLLPAHERLAFALYGLHHAEYGHKGGVARAATAQRDSRGRFVGGES